MWLLAHLTAIFMTFSLFWFSILWFSLAQFGLAWYSSILLWYENIIYIMLHYGKSFTLWNITSMQMYIICQHNLCYIKLKQYLLCYIMPSNLLYINVFIGSSSEKKWSVEVKHTDRNDSWQLHMLTCKSTKSWNRVYQVKMRQNKVICHEKPKQSNMNLNKVQCKFIKKCVCVCKFWSW